MGRNDGEDTEGELGEEFKYVVDSEMGKFPARGDLGNGENGKG